MPVNSASFAKALYPGVKAWYGEAYDEWSPEFQDLFDIDTSSRAYEEHVGQTGFGLAAIKPEGSAISYDTNSQGYLTRYVHLVYALGFIVTREAYEDDLYDVVAKQGAQSLAFSMRQTKETVAANVYNRAFNTSYTGGDGSTLVASAGGGGSATHPNFTGGTWTNGPSTASDLSEASLEQACIDIAGFTNDRGLKIQVMPEKLIIPKELQFEAERILNSLGRVGTADNDPNALRNLGKFREVVLNHYLTDTDAWFIRNKVPGKSGMVMFQRRAMEFGIDNDFDTENAKYKSSERYSVGWTDPRAIYGSPGA